LRLPVVGADANAAPDLRPVCRRRSFPVPLILNRLLAPECVLFFGIVPLPSWYVVWPPSRPTSCWVVAHRAARCLRRCSTQTRCDLVLLDRVLRFAQASISDYCSSHSA